FITNWERRLRERSEFVRQGKALIETAKGCCPCVDEESIYGLPALFVRGETHVHQLTLIASHLGSTICVNQPCVNDGVRIIFNCRGNISNGRKPQPSDR